MSGPLQLAQLPRPLAGLVGALGESVQDLSDQADRTRDGIGHRSFAPYHRYRDMVDQYSALAATVKTRLPGLSRGDRALVEDHILTSERAFLQATVRAVLDYFFALSAISNLPLGTRELFERELDFLHDAQQRLRSPEHEGQLASDLLMDLETAELILVEIMEKAPSLVSFDGAGKTPRMLLAPPR